MRKLLFLPLLALATPALAVDGVLEINQSCVAVGCFPGDSPGLPITITRMQPGSYRLTSNLITDDPDLDVIQISDSHVTLDLNGFAISGPNVCSGTPLVCTTTGVGIGINVEGTPLPAGVVVTNGIVRGMGASGIGLGASGHVEGVLVVSNGISGIGVGARSVVTDCRAERNLFAGIVTRGGTGDSTRIVGNVVSGNGFGILTTSAAGGSIILDNTVTGNSIVGAELSITDAYARNVFRGNGTEVNGGIQIGTNQCGNNTTCP